MLVVMDDIKAIWGYFKLYLQVDYGDVPEWMYVALLGVFCATAILSFSMFGTKKGLRVLSLVVLAEIVVLILCATVILRETAENREYSLVPFWSYAMESQDLQYSMYVENLMNVLMFIPLGFTLGCAFKDMGWKRIIVVALCMSAGIEILQYVMKKGFAEVDDVMHNTVGCVIGYLLVKGFRIIANGLSKSYSQ